MPLRSAKTPYGEKQQLVRADTVSMPERYVTFRRELRFTRPIGDDRIILNAVPSGKINIPVIGGIEDEMVKLPENLWQPAKILCICRLVQSRKSARNEHFPRLKLRQIRP